MNEKESGKLWRISIAFVVVFMIAAVGYFIYGIENEQTTEPVTSATTTRATTDRSYVGKWTVKNQNELTTASVTSSTAKRKTTTEKKLFVPYVGMSENMIDKTDLGKPRDEVRHNKEVMGGLAYEANLYDFEKDGWIIFTARCVQGKVIQVWDENYKHRVPTSDKSKTPSTQKSTTTDPYHADEFDDAEDFYDEYYDDFYDYYDAEDYWYEHQ